jgi:hypothetical protein
MWHFFRWLRFHLKWFWCRLWVRREEFHWTLEIDWEGIFVLSEEKFEQYTKDVIRRRSIAHDRTL